MYDWNLFENVPNTEYVHHMLGRHKFGSITTNLDALVNRFNEVSINFMDYNQYVCLTCSDYYLLFTCIGL